LTANTASQLGLDVAPTRDEKALKAAKLEALRLVFDDPANLELEQAIVRRLLRPSWSWAASVPHGSANLAGENQS
jgi:hypothetical protein